MFFRSLFVAAVAAVSFSANSAMLTTLSGPAWPPAGSTGLETVMFNKVENGEGLFVALGAHAYKNGPSLPYDDLSNTFTGSPGIYIPDGLGRANWSFDFAFSLGACTSCFIQLTIEGADDNNLYSYDSGQLPAAGAFGESWNMEMAFLGLTFDPFANSSTTFTLTAFQAGRQILTTDINVDVAAAANNNVPEPGTLALVGLALAGIGAVRRRTKA